MIKKEFIIKNNIKFEDVIMEEDGLFIKEINKRNPIYKIIDNSVLYYYNTLSISLTRPIGHC